MRAPHRQVRQPHGTRLIITEFDRLARDEPDSPWVSIPVDDNDLSKGYRNITYGQCASGVNAAIQWLREHLPASSGSFQSFAYVGGRDLRYPCFAIAAGKLGLVMICPSSTVTAEAQKRIMDQKECTIFLHDLSFADRAADLVKYDPRIRAVQAPALSDLPFDRPAVPYPYAKSWQEAKDDPWLVFHTSGTTGHPKVVTCSHSQYGAVDIVLGLEGIKETNITRYVNVRWLSPLPLLHFSGMFMVLPAAVFCRCVPVLCPATKPPSADVIKEMLKNTTVAGASMSPAMIDALCVDPKGLALLKKLRCLHYVGASLGQRSGKLLSPTVSLAPAIGSTEVGGYFIEIVNRTEDWDYISIQPHAGAVFEPRFDKMHELVFVKNPDCAFQPLFQSRPNITRFETKDLWIEHPTKKGQWKIVGRMDDYLAVAGSGGLYVAPLEPILQEHPSVLTALVGGHARPKPIMLLELRSDASADTSTPEGRSTFMKSFQPFIHRANEHCHETVKLDPRLVVFVDPEKPLARTAKDTVSRPLALKEYEKEIDAVYKQVYGA